MSPIDSGRAFPAHEIEGAFRDCWGLGGAPLDFFGVTIQVYAGGGLWSYPEDYSSWMGMMRVRSEYERLC